MKQAALRLRILTLDPHPNPLPIGRGDPRGRDFYKTECEKDRPIPSGVITPSPHHLITSSLDNLKIPLQLPIADVAAVFAFLPFARRSEMVDEGVAEPFARHGRLLQALSGIPQRAG